MSHTTMREALSEYLAGQARWREMKAEEYPGDPRNARSAKALRDAADFVITLPDDDERLQGLTAIAADTDREPYEVLPGERPARISSVYGFYDATCYPAEEFVTAFVQAVETEHDAAWHQSRMNLYAVVADKVHLVVAPDDSEAISQGVLAVAGEFAYAGGRYPDADVYLVGALTRVGYAHALDIHDDCPWAGDVHKRVAQWGTELTQARLPREEKP